jgi:ATP-binding cassette subfamily B protein
MRDFRQHDVTDCGAACLAYVFHRHGLDISISAIRQQAGTNRSGTTALGLVDTAKSCGFEAKGIRCKFDDLRSVALPGIAHVLTDSGHQHYVVVCSIGKKSMRVMDPAVGRVAKWSLEKFRACWTNVFLVLSPSLNFVPSKKNDSAWSRLLVLLRPQKAILTQAFVGVVLSTILSLSGAIYIQKIVDNVIVDGNRNLLHLLGIAMFAILLVRLAISYFQSVLMLRSAQKIDAGLILGYYRHLMRLPQSFFDTMRVGEITARVRDAVAVRDFLNGTILSLILNPLILVVALIAMFTYSWKLALFSLALVPANLAIYLASDWLNKRYQREIMERSADFDSQLVESLHAMSVVRSCGMEDEMSFRCETRLVRFLKRVWAASKAGLVIGTSGSLVTQAYSIGLLWIGASLVLDSALTAGELMSCNALAGYITGPIVAIIGMNASIRTATTATDRLYEILDLEREKDEGVAELTLEKDFEIVLDKVTFRYAGHLATLKDISLRFRSGTITALIGKSGCGKSTILSVLQRLYLPESGKISVGNIDIQHVRLESLREHISYVPQRIDLLAGSFLENIAPNETQPDMVRVVELCRRVGILEFAENLPRGLQSMVTENGANLSGGQRQRLAIVRALYLDAPIVLMDEPSSALDSESEDMLMDALKEMRARGKLVILAVHNRRLLSLCDRIVEIDDGRVLADGTPERLSVAKADSVTRTLNCISPSKESCSSRIGLVDESATEETKALFLNLRNRDCGGMLLGQMDANVMGIDVDGRGWFLESGKSDIHAVTGKMPAVYGFDIGSLKSGWMAACGYFGQKIREAYANGGAITVVWHPENFSGSGDYSSGCGVDAVLPGAPKHLELRARLDLIADNLGNLKDFQGRSIPIIFRCWQQQDGDHFWWGRSRCTPEEYIRLYRFTVTYLRDVRCVHNFLYCFAPCMSDEAYNKNMDRYPGDLYVDVLGLDAGLDQNPASCRRLTQAAAEAVRVATERGKIAALTSIGFDGGSQRYGLAHCDNPNWVREFVIEPLKHHSVASRLAFLVFNRNIATETPIYNIPIESSPHADCMLKLADDHFLVFGDRVGGLYQLYHR